MTNPATALSGPNAADAARQSAVVAALAATVGVNALANILPLNGQTTGAISDRIPLLITPPGYVFGIWGLIYSGLIGYAAYQALPAQREHPRLRRIAWPFVVSCACNALWLVLWHYNRFGLTVGAMLGLLLALILIDLRLGRMRGGPLADWLLVRLPFSVYLGWISVATIVNVSFALADAGWDGAPLTPEVWTVGLISIGAALGLAQGAGRGDAAYPLVLAWAFSGVATNNTDVPLVGGAAWGATALSLIAAGLAALRRGEQP